MLQDKTDMRFGRLAGCIWKWKVAGDYEHGK